MLMSKSRLEKFLYALYSLDSSDLPKPLSRIEELYSCLVTGEEVPTFEPLSRVEKYLMAILGVYELNELPNPISRVEVLLHKLAIGDDNLDDVKSFLSEHEELLAEIIRNGGVGGNIDIEYVLYALSTEFNTLYNTKEHSVKSAVLKGQTLVNIVNNDNWVPETDNANVNTLYTQNMSIKKSQTYTVIGKMESSDIINTSENAPAFRLCTGMDNNGTSLFFIQQSDAVIKQTFTNTENDTIHVRFFNQKTNYKKLMIIEGDYTNVDIPYFEGMQSVENPVVTITGKNLFNVSMLPQTVNITPTSTGYTLTGYSCGTGMRVSKIFPNLIVGKKYVFSFQSSNSSSISAQNSIGFYNINTDDIVYYRNNEPFTLTNEMYHERRVILYGVGNETTEFSNVQLEEGSVATEYEPYKSTTVSCNEDVELHGVGEVKDELDCFTGEVTKRVGEVVFDGSEDWEQSSHAVNSLMFYTSVNNLAHKEDYLNSIICDKLMVSANSDDLYYVSSSPNGISAYFDYYDTYPNENWLYIKYTDSEGSVEKLKQWLSQNPVTVRYELTMESVKTVDISVADQDGNNTELKTFNDITYVTLSSEGAIPEAELEVATKNKEDLDDSIVYMAHTLSEEFNTLYNTSEKPVKSAVLKGNTLVNINNSQIQSDSNFTNGVLWFGSAVVSPTIGKKYFIKLFNHNSYFSKALFGGNIIDHRFVLIDGEYAIITAQTTNNRLHIYSDDVAITPDQASNVRAIVCEYQKGMENWDIPYFEGMQSVKMPVLTTSNGDGTESNILTCNEEVELHGVGEVKDELDLMTGELTQRIGEIVLDGSEDEKWGRSPENDGVNTVVFLIGSLFIHKPKVIMDKFTPCPSNISNFWVPSLNDSENHLNNNNILAIRISKSKLSSIDISGFRQWLSKNPVTVQYELETASIKTVNLSILNKDGEPTKLKTFNDITHVTLSSEGLIPEAELEVAEKVTEVAASMFTISREQEVINTAANEQSENTDATMIATTEIYEELL